MTEPQPRSAARRDLIVALGPVDGLVGDVLHPFGDVVEVAPDGPSIQTLLADAIGLIARGTNVVDRRLLDAAPRLRVIGRSGIGFELVDLAAATARGIPVVVTPGAGSTAVAEGALALILHLVKRLGVLTDLVRDGRWPERETVAIGDLEGSTLGIVGFGRIGRRLAAFGAALGMRVVSADPFLAPGAASEANVELVDLGRLAEIADVISLHAPLTAGTSHLIDAAVLARVRPGTILVNCGRGGLLDLDAAYAALVDGRLGGVGLDVFDPEPPTAEGHPIFRHPDVVLSPHVLGLSRLGRRRVFQDMAAGMAAVLGGGRAPHIANPAIHGPTDDPGRC